MWRAQDDERRVDVVVAAFGRRRERDDDELLEHHHRFSAAPKDHLLDAGVALGLGRRVRRGIQNRSPGNAEGERRYRAKLPTVFVFTSTEMGLGRRGLGAVERQKGRRGRWVDAGGRREGRARRAREDGPFANVQLAGGIREQQLGL